MEIGTVFEIKGEVPPVSMKSKMIVLIIEIITTYNNVKTNENIIKSKQFFSNISFLPPHAQKYKPINDRQFKIENLQKFSLDKDAFKFAD